ncbi:hypothetical protein AtNW77_Chr4g0280971 [Arabidopsis thaliana]
MAPKLMGLYSPLSTILVVDLVGDLKIDKIEFNSWVTLCVLLLRQNTSLWL